jgi:hypothetical protein
MIELIGVDASFGEAELDGVVWEARVVLTPCEALLFGSGEDLAIAKQTGRGVVVET